MLTLEQLEKLKEGFAPGTVGEHVAGDNAPLFLEALDLAKLALSPPQDVSGLVEELREQIKFSDSANLRMSAEGQEPSPTDYIPCQRGVLNKLLDCVTSQAARIRGLEGREALRDRTALERDERIAELESALDPFASNYEGRELFSDENMVGGCNNPPLTNGDLRRAWNTRRASTGART